MMMMMMTLTMGCCDVDDAVGASESPSNRSRLFRSVRSRQVDSAPVDCHAGRHLLRGRLSAAALHRPLPAQRRQDSLWPDHYHHLHANIFLAMKVTRALYNGTASVRLYRQAVRAHCGR